jgi:hypothetical protein
MAAKTPPVPAPPGPTPPAATPPDPTLLEDVLVALQKTFSRLSATTAALNDEEHRDKARALIVGDVNFEIALNIDPVAVPNSDGTMPAKMGNLRYCADGSGFPIKLSGRIATDVRHAEAPVAEPPAPPAAAAPGVAP